MSSTVQPSLRGYIDHARAVFEVEPAGQEKGAGTAPYGFIEYRSNLQETEPLQTPTLSIPYGFQNVWFKQKKGYDLERIKIIKERRKKDTRIYLRDLNLITPEDIYSLFEFEVYMQNNYGAILQDSTGRRVSIQKNRYNLKPGSRASFIQKRIRKELKPIKQVIMLSLSMYQPEIQKLMPENTNLSPIEWAILHAWEYLNKFLKRLRDYMKRRGLPWGYIGAIMEFQDDEDTNGFPHFHVLFTNRWLGPIDEIAGLWDYAPAHGVDFMTKAKWEKQNPGKKYTPLRLAKYLSKYLSKSQFYDKDKGIHKCHAMAAFYGVRQFNFAHEYRQPKEPKEKSDVVWKFVGMEST